jgi:hypothetical protein
MITTQNRKYRIAAFAASYGEFVFSTFYQTVKELVLKKCSVCVPPSDMHRIAGVVNEPPDNEHI